MFKRPLICFVLFLLIQVSVSGQRVYSGFSPGKYRVHWDLQINPDSSVTLVRLGEVYNYDEYNGTIRKINDTLFRVQCLQNYSQGSCRAIGDSQMYISADSVWRKRVREITLTYSDKYTFTVPLDGKEHLEIPLDKMHFGSIPPKNTFSVSTGHLNPVSHTPATTLYKYGDEYCMDLYSEPGFSFEVVIRGNTIRKTGKGRIDEFELKRSNR